MITSTRSASVRPLPDPASLVWLPRLLVAVIVGATIGTLTGCGGADDPQGSSAPLPLDTWSTAGERASGTGSSAASSSTTTGAATGATGATGAGPSGTGGTDTPTPTEPVEPADAGSAAADAATACVQPTDEGNSAGVGKFCTTSTDCGPSLLCSAAFGAPAGATFCSLICSTDADCGGSGATCFAAMGTKACVTAACAPLASTLF